MAGHFIGSVLVEQVVDQEAIQHWMWPTGRDHHHPMGWLPREFSQPAWPMMGICSCVVHEPTVFESCCVHDMTQQLLANLHQWYWDGMPAFFLLSMTSGQLCLWILTRGILPNSLRMIHGFYMGSWHFYWKATRLVLSEKSDGKTNALPGRINRWL